MNQTINNSDILKLINRIDFSDLNDDIINHNIEKLIEYFNKLQLIYNSLLHIQLIHNIETFDSNMKNMLLGLFKYSTIQKFIKKTSQIIKIEYDDILFYYLIDTMEQYEKDKILINELFKITLTLYRFQTNIKEQKITVIWVPINKARNFNHVLINDITLKTSEDNYEAFTASGLTFENTTIITRYEEIKKLLMHELIHNFHLDGHHCHSSMCELKQKYNSLKKNNYKYMFDFYESYTELLSSYFNILFNLIHRKELTIHVLKAYIIIEMVYSLNTVLNLIRINGYVNYDEFYNKQYFKGDICIYEYYYLKSLMYNNFKLYNIYKCHDFKIFYENILKINKDDVILRKMKDFYVVNSNFKYCYVDKCKF